MVPFLYYAKRELVVALTANLPAMIYVSYCMVRVYLSPSSTSGLMVSCVP